MAEPEATSAVHASDPHFDKKLLALLFLVDLLVLVFVSIYPVEDRTAQITLVTTLTGTLSAIMGGIITLTSGRSTQRTTDTKGGSVSTTETDSDK